jgi:Transglycosylase SLT domain
MTRGPTDGSRERNRPALGVAARALARGLGWKIAAGGSVALLCLLCFAGLFFAVSPSPASEECSLRGASGQGIPADYVPWLRKAAVKYKLGPQGFSILAAIHKVESDFGRSPLPGVHSGTNSAGAAGPGQFLFSTWAKYGVDANGDGRRDIYSIPDSVFATANYLHASGAPGDWRAAIFAYNHAEWYVEEVLETAASFGAGMHEICTSAAGSLGETAARSLARIEYVAKWIESQRIHYCWGGGHGPRPGPSPGSGEFCGPGVRGLDCSGAVRWLLVLSGYPDPGGLVSNELGAHYPAGRGAHVTIWSNVDHVFLEINGRDWGTSDANFDHGPGYGAQPSAGFLPSHPHGL